MLLASAILLAHWGVLDLGMQDNNLLGSSLLDTAARSAHISVVTGWQCDQLDGDDVARKLCIGLGP